MSLEVITPANLTPVLLELEDPGSLRFQAVQTMVDYALGASKSPFTSGSLTIEEEVLLPPCIRLGVATRVIEVYRGIESRTITCGSFEREIGIAIAYGHIPPKALRTEMIFWEQIIPSYVAFGYISTTAGH